ncbi:hypothetical protein KK083_28000 [Fulvivirgaceae bacterium PWU4]|uniref:Uncharacterized protein n=1 Tax=Chryseosolibacter histidini TaxID=2782349 RepID=A0AAP2DQS3_9BACT|nr:hypothetical protein [Chryseosolibacter histidini]MBT1700766.1 hypothetical protein [Chryseosolibacter histidini]
MKSPQTTVHSSAILSGADGAWERRTPRSLLRTYFVHLFYARALRYNGILYSRNAITLASFRMTVFQGLAMDYRPWTMDYRLTVSTLSTSLGTTSY